MSNRTTKYNIKKITDERAYSIIKTPVITEKATMGSQDGKVTFRVSIDASKPEIKQAVERLFNVKVEAVNTTLLKGKVKRFKNTIGKRSDVKKAIVTLAAGQTIDVAGA
jgi:large subunit ribosomal protein L23